MNNEIKEGQVWRYKNRKGEEKSRLTVLKVEDLDSYSIVHIKIDGLKLKQKDSKNKRLTSIGHLPISLEMFNKSIIHLEATIDTSITDGYMYWKKMHIDGQAGIWSVEISEAIKMTDNLIKK